LSKNGSSSHLPSGFAVIRGIFSLVLPHIDHQLKDQGREYIESIAISTGSSLRATRMMNRATSRFIQLSVLLGLTLGSHAEEGMYFG
jgi:hypothetical protein